MEAPTGPTGPTGPNLLSDQFNTDGTLSITDGTGNAYKTSSGAWLTSGNGNVSTSNFLGATNAANLIFETNSVERMRLMSAGHILINNTKDTANATLSAYTSGINSNLSATAISGYGNMEGFTGIYGFSNSATGTGVRSVNLFDLWHRIDSWR